jgi:hypothetical protein
MDLYTLILSLITNPQNKSILEIGAHDDLLSKQLCISFKKVFAYYEFVKIPERVDGNLEIRKLPYLKILERLGKFDVILLENEFHHFPDIWQMWTFDKLKPQQELLLVEWDFTGNSNYFYSSFQNCVPLCQLTREILDTFVKHKIIKIGDSKKGKYETTILNKEDLMNHYKFMLPDHWRYGEQEFMSKIANVRYPLRLWEGFDLYKIRRYENINH